ncbi:MAG: septum formation inhibitor Maf [Saprospiraceae bacterium]|uniref:Septum formation inhibitor Maf n=1 Tax=Candidatus Opimibacter skivensis TaxID=2982028 RepID=A0A9D7SS02_9BACT|nr:septum formation inhibitor Maf [Candidatus Opimibacter skivensis]
MIVAFSRFLLLGYLVGIVVSCSKPSSNIPEIDQKIFAAYWEQGKGELSSYTLDQSRYNVQHEGSVVLVFATEEMSNTKQVRLDDPKRNSGDAVKVLKLNTNKEFVTGLNKYSMMSSVFTPLDYNEHARSFKLSTSCQDWDGQSYTQLNWKGNRYEVKQMSYEESEDDKSFSLVSTWLEDEIWTKIRVAPNTLPIGNVTMIPSVMYSHLSLQPIKAYDAVASIKSDSAEYTYSIQYPEIKRAIDINFQKSFPYKIIGWKETSGNNEVTTARISNTIISDYWLHNQPQDSVLRDELHLK